MFRNEKNEDSKLRLFPSELNRLVDAEAKRNAAVLLSIPVEGKSSMRQEGFACYFFIKNGKEFCLFHTIKDSSDKKNEEQLPFFGELFSIVQLDPRFKNATILLPMMQCRGFMKLPIAKARRAHIVLAEIDMTKRSVSVHDSQSIAKYKVYPDHLIDIAKDNGFSYAYLAYDSQKNDVMCGYFVDQFMKAIINGGECRMVAVPLMKIHGHIVFYVNVNKDDYYRNKNDYLLRYAPSEESAYEPDKPRSRDAF